MRHAARVLSDKRAGCRSGGLGREGAASSSVYSDFLAGCLSPWLVVQRDTSKNSRHQVFAVTPCHARVWGWSLGQSWRSLIRALLGWRRGSGVRGWMVLSVSTCNLLFQPLDTPLVLPAGLSANEQWWGVGHATGRAGGGCSSCSESPFSRLSSPSAIQLSESRAPLVPAGVPFVRHF